MESTKQANTIEAAASQQEGHTGINFILLTTPLTPRQCPIRWTRWSRGDRWWSPPKHCHC